LALDQEDRIYRLAVLSGLGLKVVFHGLGQAEQDRWEFVFGDFLKDAQSLKPLGASLWYIALLGPHNQRTY